MNNIKDIMITYECHNFGICIFYKTTSHDYELLLEELKELSQEMTLVDMQNKFRSLIEACDPFDPQLGNGFRTIQGDENIFEELPKPRFDHLQHNKKSGFLKDFFYAGHILSQYGTKIQNIDYIVDLDYGKLVQMINRQEIRCESFV